MQIKVGVKTNDNENVEEWWPANMLAEKLGVTSLALTLEKVQDILGGGLVTQAEVLIYLASHVDKLQARIERLESIIVSMGAGCESSWPDDSISHTHWIYPLNGAKNLVNEIVQEHHKQQIDDGVTLCPRCGGLYKNDPIGIAVSGDLCPECESELAEEATYLDHADCPTWAETTDEPPF